MAATLQQWRANQAIKIVAAVNPRSVTASTSLWQRTSDLRFHTGHAMPSFLIFLCLLHHGSVCVFALSQGLLTPPVVFPVKVQPPIR